MNRYLRDQGVWFQAMKWAGTLVYGAFGQGANLMGWDNLGQTARITSLSAALMPQHPQPAERTAASATRRSRPARKEHARIKMVLTDDTETRTARAAPSRSQSEKCFKDSRLQPQRHSGQGRESNTAIQTTA